MQSARDRAHQEVQINLSSLPVCQFACHPPIQISELVNVRTNLPSNSYVPLPSIVPSLAVTSIFLMDEWFDDPFFKGDAESHFRAMHDHMNKMVDSMFRGFGEPMFGLGFDGNKGGNSRPALEGGGRSTHRPRVEEVSGDAGATTSHRQPIIEEPDDQPRYSGSRFGDSDRSDRFGSSGRTDRFGDSGRSDRFGASGRTDRFGDSGRSDRFGSSGRTDRFGDSGRSDRSGSSGRGGAEKPQSYFYSASMSSYYGPDGVQQSRKKVYDSATGKTEMAEMRKLGDQAVAMKREIDRDGRVTDTVDRKNVDEADVESFRHRWDEKARSGNRLLYSEPAGQTSHRRALK